MNSNHSSRRPKVGLLALTLELYETLVPGLRTHREAWVRSQLIPALERQMDVIFDGAVFQREAIEGSVQRIEAAGADVLLVVLLTYAPSQIALPALARTRLPLVIWNVQELSAVDASFSPAAMIDNHGVHGTQDIANVLCRAEIPFHYVTSHPADPDALAELFDFCGAAAAVRRLHSARIGLLGYPFPGMGDFAVDTTHLAASLGCTWTPLSVDEYNQRAATADPDCVRSLVAEYRAAYAVAPDVTTNDLDATARVELASRGLVADHRLDAWSYQFLAFGEDERTSTVPFVAASRLMAEGVGFAGEGDLVGAAATALFHNISGAATFSEMFTIDFAGNTLFMSHMGETNVALARRDRPVPLVARPTPIVRTRDRQLALVTALEPGTATFAALAAGPRAAWRILFAPVTVEDFGPLPGFCVPHFKIRPAGDVRRFLSAYATAGGPHHNAVCRGDVRRSLRFAAKLLGAEAVEL
jgi:L-arabinose isomerase